MHYSTIIRDSGNRRWNSKNSIVPNLYEAKKAIAAHSKLLPSNCSVGVMMVIDNRGKKKDDSIALKHAYAMADHIIVIDDDGEHVVKNRYGKIGKMIRV